MLIPRSTTRYNGCDFGNCPEGLVGRNALAFVLTQSWSVVATDHTKLGDHQ